MYAARGARASRRHRRPLDRHARRPDPRTSYGARSRPPPTRPATRRPSGPPETRQAARRLAVPPARRDRAGPRRRAARGRHQGAGRLAADAARARPGRHGRLSPSSPTRPTPWARRWWALARSPPTRSPVSARSAPALLWLNSPSNPTGRVLPVAHLRKVVDWCRERGTLVVSDECYLECAWEGEPVSVLHPEVCGGSHDGVLAVHSLSKRSNLAGYRCGFVAGDPARGRRAARRPQEPRADPARPAAGRDGSGAGRRRARRGAARALRRPACHAAGGAGGLGLPRRPLRGVALPVGHPRRGLLADGRPARRPGHPGGAGHVLRRGGRAARPGGAHRDRRAHRRRCRRLG